MFDDSAVSCPEAPPDDLRESQRQDSLVEAKGMSHAFKPGSFLPNSPFQAFFIATTARQPFSVLFNDREHTLNPKHLLCDG